MLWSRTRTRASAARKTRRERKGRLFMWKRRSHDDKDDRDNNTLYTSAKDRICDDGKGLVCDHVGEEEGDEEEMAILANGLDLVCILALESVWDMSRVATRRHED